MSITGSFLIVHLVTLEPSWLLNHQNFYIQIDVELHRFFSMILHYLRTVPISLKCELVQVSTSKNMDPYKSPLAETINSLHILIASMFS